jgi:hypothetical protein
MMMVMKFRVDVKGEGESNNTLSRRWLKHSGASRKCYLTKEKTPVFKGAYEKLRKQWPKFVAFKASERAKEMLEKNKANAEKKEHHHILGPGGYKSTVPKWEAMENELRNKGITLGTEGWPKRAKHWWYGHGGSLDPATGELFIGNRPLLP